MVKEMKGLLATPSMVEDSVSEPGTIGRACYPSSSGCTCSGWVGGGPDHMTVTANGSSEQKEVTDTSKRDCLG